MIFKHAFNFILSTIAPSYCMHCRVFLPDAKALCQNCYSLLSPVASKELSLSNGSMLKIYAIAEYKDPLRSFILAKNSGSTFASIHLARLMAERIPLKSVSCDMLVPVPLHWKRYARRGFNQAEVIANELSRFIEKPVTKLLKRKKNTVLQASIEANQRAENVVACFEMVYAKEVVEGKNVILVDDLMTTGSTLRAAANTLIPFKPSTLTALVACRTL